MARRKEKGFSVRMSPFAAALQARFDGFPYHYLTEEEKEANLRRLLKYDLSNVIKDGRIKQVTYYNALASCYFPHMWSVEAGGKRTPRALFEDFVSLIEAMKKFAKIGDRTKAELAEEKQISWLDGFMPESQLTKSSLRKALRTFSGTQCVSNFSPVAAGALYHKLLPKAGGVVFDPSMGWGGRLVGAIGCRKVKKYIGCDPGTETFKGLERMRDELLPMVRKMDRNLDVELHKLGSETKEMRDGLKPNSVDLAFTSPPYFLQEKYSDDLTQSCVRYGDQESWLNDFMGQTLDNCAYCLKHGGTLAINIANVSSYRGSLQDDFLALATRKGFVYVKTLELQLSAMPGTKHKYGKHKAEPVFVFRKRYAPDAAAPH